MCIIFVGFFVSRDKKNFYFRSLGGEATKNSFSHIADSAKSRTIAQQNKRRKQGGRTDTNIVFHPARICQPPVCNDDG